MNSGQKAECQVVATKTARDGKGHIGFEPAFGPSRLQGPSPLLFRRVGRGSGEKFHLLAQNLRNSCVRGT